MAFRRKLILSKFLILKENLNKIARVILSFCIIADCNFFSVHLMY